MTENTYYFSCTLRPDIASPRLLLTVFHRERSQRDTVLWKGPIQVLAGAPLVDSVTLVGAQPGTQTSVVCNPKQVCLTLVGDLRKGQGASVEVRGNNLPASLTLEFPGCEIAAAAQDPQNTALRTFNCAARTSGIVTLRVLSAPNIDGGIELMASPVTLLQ